MIHKPNYSKETQELANTWEDVLLVQGIELQDYICEGLADNTCWVLYLHSTFKPNLESIIESLDEEGEFIWDGHYTYTQYIQYDCEGNPSYYLLITIVIG